MHKFIHVYIYCIHCVQNDSMNPFMMLVLCYQRVCAPSLMSIVLMPEYNIANFPSMLLGFEHTVGGPHPIVVILISSVRNLNCFGIGIGATEYSPVFIVIVHGPVTCPLRFLRSYSGQVVGYCTTATATSLDHSLFMASSCLFLTMHQTR